MIPLSSPAAVHRVVGVDQVALAEHGRLVVKEADRPDEVRALADDRADRVVREQLTGECDPLVPGPRLQVVAPVQVDDHGLGPRAAGAAGVGEDRADPHPLGLPMRRAVAAAIDELRVGEQRDPMSAGSQQVRAVRAGAAAVRPRVAEAGALRAPRSSSRSHVPRSRRNGWRRSSRRPSRSVPRSRAIAVGP